MGVLHMRPQQIAPVPVRRGPSRSDALPVATTYRTIQRCRASEFLTRGALEDPFPTFALPVLITITDAGTFDVVGVGFIGIRRVIRPRSTARAGLHPAVRPLPATKARALEVVFLAGHAVARAVGALVGPPPPEEHGAEEPSYCWWAAHRWRPALPRRTDGVQVATQETPIPS